MRRLAPADAFRIPLGLVIGWVGALGLYKGITTADASFPAIITTILSILFGLTFLAVALVMTFNWLWTDKP